MWADGSVGAAAAGAAWWRRAISRAKPRPRSRRQRRRALLARGRERYDIYCAPCHGLAGDGDGIIVAARLSGAAVLSRAAPAGGAGPHFYDAITNGYGVMYSYADRVAPHDRWAIVAYIRALATVAARHAAQAPEARSSCHDPSTRQ